ncbi:MAG TPA: hypothetical protein VNM43_10930 [Dehalococcoidia bacterium]|nr:hypothetical protein [Dehalococcoidia bacterium]
MAPWILLELMAEQRQREAERAVEHAPARSLTDHRRAGAVRSWLARTLYAAAMCLDRSVAGNGARAAGHAA